MTYNLALFRLGVGCTPWPTLIEKQWTHCGNPLPTQRVRGIVVDGVYHRHPLAGDREHLINPISMMGDTWPDSQGDDIKHPGEQTAAGT